MVHFFREINHLLLQDIIYLSKDDLGLIHSNNRKKSALLNELKSLALSLKNYNLGTHPELIEVLSDLKIEITRCFKSIVINNNIINVNLDQLREILDTLLTNNESSSHLYDMQGGTKS